MTRFFCMHSITISFLILSIFVSQSIYVYVGSMIMVFFGVCVVVASLHVSFCWIEGCMWPLTELLMEGYWNGVWLSRETLRINFQVFELQAVYHHMIGLGSTGMGMLVHLVLFSGW